MSIVVGAVVVCFLGVFVVAVANVVSVADFNANTNVNVVVFVGFCGFLVFVGFCWFLRVFVGF